VGSLTSIILGLYYIASYKTDQDDATKRMFPMGSVYSAHSWMGIVTVALFGVQCIFSVAVFCVIDWGGYKDQLKEECIAVHHFMGHCLFAMALATSMTGFQDMQSSDLAESYSMPPIANSSSVMIAMDGYAMESTNAELASATSVLLLCLGISTFAALKFLPTVIANKSIDIM